MGYFLPDFFQDLINFSKLNAIVQTSINKTHLLCCEKFTDMHVPTMAEFMAKGEKPEVLFWVGCAGSFDERNKKVVRAFVSLLKKANIRFAVLGNEEKCTGDPARRIGNEFLFQGEA
jgi:Fe-S oxidoreductase